MSAKVAMAVSAHPDDIELMMAGTLILLGTQGYQIHVMNVANGSCGTASLPVSQIVPQRRQEAQNAAKTIGARYHPPLVHDFGIYYEPKLLAKVAAVVRRIKPNILLLPSPEDYMEDHINVSRLMVSAAFTRGMANFATDPREAPYEDPVALYHALPWGLLDPLRRPVPAELFVDIGSVLDKKTSMLACHISQKEWLAQSQGVDYLNLMREMAARVGCQARTVSHAEGWRRHLHLGFAPEDYDPLSEALVDFLIGTDLSPEQNARL